MSLPLNIDWQQILLHLFNFAILSGGLYMLLYKPVKDFMTKREEEYKAKDEEANRIVDEAKSLKEQYETHMIVVDKEIENKRLDAERELEEYHDQQVKYAHEEADRIIDRARESAKREHDAMIRSYTQEVKELAVSAAEKALIKAEGDPFEDFLTLAERSSDVEETE